jgi:hypothetical protein
MQARTESSLTMDSEWSTGLLARELLIETTCPVCGFPAVRQPDDKTLYVHQGRNFPCRDV